MLTFDEEKHVYYFNDIEILNVTKILAPLNNFDGIPEDILEHARARGKAVHYGCELLDSNTLDYSCLHPEIKPYLTAWEKFKRETGFIVIENELRVYHKKYCYAGTLDVIGIVNGEKWLLDRKATAKISPVTALQTAAYAAPFEEPMRRFCIQLKRNGEYSLEEYKSKSDFPEFLGMLNYHKAKNFYQQMKGKYNG